MLDRAVTRSESVLCIQYRTHGICLDSSLFITLHNLYLGPVYEVRPTIRFHPLPFLLTLAAWMLDPTVMARPTAASSAVSGRHRVHVPPLP
jgi:hypothetical protein